MPLVYANGENPEDCDLPEKRGLDLKEKIVLVRPLVLDFARIREYPLPMKDKADSEAIPREELTCSSST